MTGSTRPVGRMTCSTMTPPDCRSSVRTGRRADEEDLLDPLLPLHEVQRPVVERGRKAEPVLDQHFLARAIPRVHPTHLRDGLVALVHDDHRVLGKVVEQGRRRLARCAAGQMPRVVLDPVAVADLLHHLQVEHCPLMEPLGFQDLAAALQLGEPLGQLGPDGLDGLHPPGARRHEVRLRIDRSTLVPLDLPARERVEGHELVHLVAEEPDAQPKLLVGREHLDDVPADPERAARELVVVPLVLDLHQLAQDLVPLNPLSALERQDERVVRLRGSQAVDARHAGDDDDIVPLEKGPRRGQPQPVDLVVDDGFLLDVGVRRRHVRFGLVVVVVADEELHGIPRKESTELLIQLRRERLVVHHHQRGPIHAREDLRHREGLAGPGDTEQDLGPVAARKPFDQLRNGRGLVTPKLEVAFELERRGRRNRRILSSSHLVCISVADAAQGVAA